MKRSSYLYNYFDFLLGLPLPREYYHDPLSEPDGPDGYSCDNQWIFWAGYMLNGYPLIGFLLWHAEYAIKVSWHSTDGPNKVCARALSRIVLWQLNDR
jgi:hypothetical protein